MKVTGTRTTLVDAAFPRLLGDANLPVCSPRTSSLALVVETDGQDLIGLAPVSPGAGTIVDALTPLLIGENPRSVAFVGRARS